VDRFHHQDVSRTTLLGIGMSSKIALSYVRYCVELCFELRKIVCGGGMQSKSGHKVPTVAERSCDKQLRPATNMALLAASSCMYCTYIRHENCRIKRDRLMDFGSGRGPRRSSQKKIGAGWAMTQPLWQHSSTIQVRNRRNLAMHSSPGGKT